MLNPSDKKRLIMQRHWPVDILGEFLGLTTAAIERLARVSDGMVDRFDVERELTHQDRASLQSVALRNAIPYSSLKTALLNGVQDLAPAIDLAPYVIGECYLVPVKFIEAWIRELLPRDKLWGSFGTRSRELARVLSCEPLLCKVSEYFGESPPKVASVRCIATWDYVSRAHEEAVDNGKYLSLAPDLIGWHALYEDRDLLSKLYRTDHTNLIEYVTSLGESW